MKVAFLNPPSPHSVIRRYTCSYLSESSLFPPLELMYLAAIVEQWKQGQALMIDAIAESYPLGKVVERLKIF